MGSVEGHTAIIVWIAAVVERVVLLDAVVTAVAVLLVHGR
jgi:hypothetical protein